MTDQPKPAETPAAGGWGAVNAVERHLGQQKVLVKGNRALLAMNKPGGFDCPSCAWPDPRRPHVAEYCENGAKAVAWEATRKRAAPDFFAAHTVAELKTWSDHRLEETGRLTHPLRYDAASDRYEPVTWDEALKGIGSRLRGLDPGRVEFYTSGRASNEAAFLWQLFGRAFGTNNFPDCSDMCHATTTTALPESIGVGKGTVSLDDWDLCDAVFIIGQNPGTNSPRMMSHLHAMAKKGVPIVAFNPLRERALLRFADPQSPREMLTGASQRIASSFFQVRTGGDMLALHGVAKAVIARDDAALASGAERVLDAGFIAEHTSGFEAFALYCRALAWDEIERVSGLSRAEIEHAAEIYCRATKVIACWGMGITQHADGGDALQAIVNLLLLRGNLGRPGAGACPVRGHSNVQGDRTVGINKTPTEGFLESLDKVFAIRSPRKHGHDTAECCEAILSGEVDAFLALGGNFFRAIPDTDRIEPEVGRIGLTVHMATKLNRSHLLHGREAYLLPVLGRTELDLQDGVRQSVTVEDSFSCVHASTGHMKPASEECRSEPWIVAALAEATLGPVGAVRWPDLGRDYALIRDRIEAVLPDLFFDYNERILEPGGFRLPNAAAERRWNTASGRANFLFDPAATARALSRTDAPGLQLMTLRSHDQFNTTIYSDSDRYRGISGERMVVFLNREDMRRAGLAEGDRAELRATYGDGVERRLEGLKVVPYDLPEGCCAAYYPEANGLLPLGHRDRRSDTPAAKSIPVTMHGATERPATSGLPEARETEPA